MRVGTHAVHMGCAEVERDISVPRVTHTTKHTKPPILPILGLLVGLAILAAPIITDLYASWVNSQAISSMTSVSDDLNSPARLSCLAHAYQYNASLAGVPYQDMKETATEELVADAQARGENAEVPDVGSEPSEQLDYQQQLSYGQDTAIAWVELPKIGVKLPVYHGTSDEALAEGSGHLEGSSLPVGGLSTHTVLTAHSGTHTQRMFDDIRRLDQGDVFVIHTLGVSYAYEVDSSEVVLPDEIQSLAIQPGKDLCTLVTCTPYGVNDHRLLVHAHRTTRLPEAPSAGDAIEGLLGIRTLPLMLAAAVLVGLVVVHHILRRKGRRHAPRHIAS